MMDCVFVRIVVNVKPDNPRTFLAPIVITKSLLHPASVPAVDGCRAAGACRAAYSPPLVCCL